MSDEEENFSPYGLKSYKGNWILGCKPETLDEAIGVDPTVYAFAVDTWDEKEGWKEVYDLIHPFGDGLEDKDRAQELCDYLNQKAEEGEIVYGEHVLSYHHPEYEFLTGKP